MSLCVVDGKHCSCQPEDGCPCPGVEAQRRKIEELERSHRRYEYLRTLTVPQFQALYMDNIRKGRHFDDLVDEAITRLHDQSTELQK